MLSQHKKFLEKELAKVSKAKRSVDMILESKRKEKNKGFGMGMMFY